jgi:hypothetical protein
MKSRDIATPFSSSGLDSSESLTSRPCRFTPWETAAGTHFMEGWVGPTSLLDAVE